MKPSRTFHHDRMFCLLFMVYAKYFFWETMKFQNLFSFSVHLCNEK